MWFSGAAGTYVLSRIIKPADKERLDTYIPMYLVTTYDIHIYVVDIRHLHYKSLQPECKLGAGNDCNTW